MKPFLSLIALLLYSTSLYSQDISGYWQGITYAPGSSTNEYWAYSIFVQQIGNDLKGELRTQDSQNEKNFAVYELTGKIQNNIFEIQLGKILKENRTSNFFWCLDGKGFLTYNLADESLKGKLSYTNCGFNSNVELFFLKLKTKNKFCKNEEIKLEVSGKNIKWYDDENKSKLLSIGNFFEPSISQTTTFYVTQTHYNTESPVAPIKIEITDNQIDELKIVETTCTSNMGSLTVIVKGNDPVKYSIDGTNFQNSNQFNDLLPGNYTVTITDQSNCIVTKSFNLSPTLTPTLTDVKIIPTTCGLDNGSIKASASGGEGVLEYSFDGQTFFTSTSFENLKAGDYNFVVKDSKGCKDVEPIRVEKSESPKIINISSKNVTCGEMDGTITIEANGGTSPLFYSVDNTTFNISPYFKDLESNEYKIMVKDSKGCTLTQKIKVRSDCKNIVIIPNAFSPNQDGINDELNIYFQLKTVKVRQFIIFDRWGNEVFSGIPNIIIKNGDILWDGKSNGLYVSSGVYVYLLEVEFENGETHIFRNPVNVF